MERCIALRGGPFDGFKQFVQIECLPPDAVILLEMPTDTFLHFYRSTVTIEQAAADLGDLMLLHDQVRSRSLCPGPRE
jgi:hypothetical protein